VIYKSTIAIHWHNAPTLPVVTVAPTVLSATPQVSLVAFKNAQVNTKNFAILRGLYNFLID
jgi:hypothetical protein